MVRLDGKKIVDLTMGDLKDIGYAVQHAESISMPHKTGSRKNRGLCPSLSYCGYIKAKMADFNSNPKFYFH